MPGTITTPGKPTGLSVHLDENGNLISQCDPEARATRYRWRGLIVGLETENRLLASAKEPMASLATILPGQTLQLIVQAVNENLQGVASDPIFFTMPPLPATKPTVVEPKAPTTTAEIPVPVRTNGNGQGHEDGQRRSPRV
jgi:hypothetical protein